MRVNALRQLGILDSTPEPVYDDLAVLASQVCQTPIALVTLVDSDRQWFKARVGLDTCETHRDHAFCSYTILRPDDLLEVPDTSVDPRFDQNPFVVGAPHIRFYAGASIVSAAGRALGTVCVIDHVPRRLTLTQAATLKMLARQAAAHLESRERVLELEHARSALDNEVVRRRAFLAEASDAVIVLRSDFTLAEASHKFYEILGCTEAEGMKLRPWDWDVRLCTRELFLANLSLNNAARSVFETVWLRKDGTRVEIEVTGSRVQVADETMLVYGCRDITERNERKRVAQDARRLLMQMGKLAKVGGWEVDMVHMKASWTEETYRIHEVDSTVQPRIEDGILFYAPEARPAISEAVRKLIETGESYDLELPFITAKGRRLFVRALGFAEHRDGRAVRIFGAFQDITDRVLLEQARQEGERRLRLITDNLPAFVAHVDADERYRFVNAYIDTVTGLPPALMLGRTMRDVCGEEFYSELSPHIAAALRGEHVTFQGAGMARQRQFQYQCNYIPDIGDDGVVQGFYAMMFDITELKDSQAKLAHMAHVDPLTGLSNRRLFEVRLAEAMDRTRASGRPMAIMFLDIDHFKRFNDSLGHAGGDEVLCEFARRLSGCVRATDFVARLAGDEFVILLENLDTVAAVSRVAEKIVVAVRHPMTVLGQRADVTTSVGVASYYGTEENAAELLALADRALYSSKREGRDRFFMV